MKRVLSLLLCSLALLVVVKSVHAVATLPPAQPPASEVTPDPWPKTTEVNGTKYVIYHPNLDSWDGYHYAAHAAVSVLPAGAARPTVGAIEITANAITNRGAQTVYLDKLTVANANFPTDPDSAAAYRQVFQQLLSAGPSTMPLGRLEYALVAQRDGHTDQPPVVVANNPPQVIFSSTPAVLVLIDGAPIWRPLPDTSLSRVINTQALILRGNNGRIYLHLRDGFLRASSLSGPWTVATDVPPEANAIARNLSQASVVDLMAGEPDETTGQPLSLRQGFPRIIIATTPTELIVTDGAPQWSAIPNTSLSYVGNTTGNVFKSQRDGQLYLLVTGRWFRASDFNGPWQYVADRDLPVDFANIPDDSPKENVKASIPGTAQAQDALVANDIPQMAEVAPGSVQFTPGINGDPQLLPIDGTPLAYVANSTAPVIRVADDSWYAVQNGVWFTASSVAGPWAVATTVPPVIYSIPPTSPLYYVTFVKIYDVTPQNVVEGYTPGYLGTVETTDGTVVYGTGYYYPAYIVDNYWYPTPITYGYAANICWTPWTGWFFGFGLGWVFGEEFGEHHYHDWGPAPYWGAMPGHHHNGPFFHGGEVAWGPNHWTVAAGNVYQRFGMPHGVARPAGGYTTWSGNAWNSRIGHAYNSTTGRVAAGQRVPVQHVYTGNFAYTPRSNVAAPGGNNLYTDHNGQIYRNTGNGWQQSQNGQWNTVREPQRVQSLQTQQWAQQAGNQRSAAPTWSAPGSNNFRAQAVAPSSISRWNGGQFSGSRGGNWGSFRGGGGGEGGFRGGGRR